METRAKGFWASTKSVATGISMLPSFLIGLLIVIVVAAIGYGIWAVIDKCEGKGLWECAGENLNPIPASYGRGVGEPLRCASGEDYDAGLCYSKCPAGFNGVGPVCWQPCPSGFRDDGVSCAKPAAYGRGAGYPWQFGDGVNDSGMFSRCEKDHGRGRCEKDGAIVYPKCRAGFHKVGCCICSPNCPSGMTDAGVTCTKQTQTRGVGKPIHACPDSMDKDGALCYPKCRDGFTGVGPVCWERKA